MVVDFIKKYKFEVLAGIITLVCASIVFYFSKLRFSTDDQFIIFRYVDNIVSGNGFVYNIGERILGSTTPLYTLLLALVKYVLRPISIPDIAGYVNLILISVSGVFFYKISKLFFSENISLLAVLVFALTLAKTVQEGMETPLFIFAILCLLYYLLNEKNYTASIFLSLAILTRPDVVIVALLVFIYWWNKNGFYQAIRFITVSIAVTLPWLIFSTLYFGSFVPQSVITKMHTKDIVNMPRLQGMKAQLADMSRIYWGRIFDPDNILFQTIINLLPYLLFVLVGIWKKINKDNWIIFGVPAIYFIFFSISNPIMFPWYISQLEPFWILISFFGFSVLFEKVKNKSASILIVIIVLVGPAYYWTGRLQASTYNDKINLYTEMASYLNQNIKPGDTVGLDNIGVVGFYTKANIIDFFGLVNDYAVSFYPVIDSCADKNLLYSEPLALVKFKTPDWVILAGKEEDEPCFNQSQWFESTYARVSINGVKSDYIWERKN